MRFTTQDRYRVRLMAWLTVFAFASIGIGVEVCGLWRNLTA